jgi:hypothetical protein
MKKILLITVLIITAILGFLSYEGIWASANIEKSNEGGYLMIGMEHRGAYYKISNTMKRLEKEVTEAGIENPSFAGIYYDDPDKVAKDSLRSFAAVIINNATDSAKLLSMKGYKVVNLERGNALICDMKTQGMVSSIIAIYKAYPAFTAYFVTHPEEAKTIKYTYELYKEDTTRFVFQY